MTPLATHPTPSHHQPITNPWFHVSFGAKIKALPVVQETVNSQVSTHPLLEMQEVLSE